MFRLLSMTRLRSLRVGILATSLALGLTSTSAAAATPAQSTTAASKPAIFLCANSAYYWTNTATTNVGLYLCVGYQVSTHWPAGQVLNTHTATVSIKLQVQQWAYPEGPYMGSWTSPTFNLPWLAYHTVTPTTIGKKAYTCVTVWASGASKGSVCG